MLKKFTAVAAASVFVLYAAVMPNIQADDSTQYVMSDAAMVIHGLGLVDSVADDIMTGQITRGDVAQIIYNISKLGDVEVSNFNENKWEDDFFGELSQDLKTPKEPKFSEYGDVQENNPYYEAVTFVSTYGMMKGNSDGSFNVDEVVTYSDACEIMLDFMGFERIAQAKGGYTALASQLKINMPKKDDDILTYDEFLRFLYKCFDVELPQTENSGGKFTVTYDENKTFLSMILGLNIVRGRLLDNGISSLISASDIGKEYIKIDDTLIHTDEEHDYIRNYLGYEVSCYYTNDESSEPGEAVYAAKVKQNGCVSFNIEDFEGLTKNFISYDDKSGRSKRINLTDGYNMIVNGMAESSFTEDMFDFDFGTVNVLRARSSSGYDLIVIEGYNSTFVTNTDKASNTIFIKNVPSKEDSEICLDDFEYVTIIDYEGNKKSLYDINAGSVIDISKNTNIIKIIISNSKKTQITLKGKDTEENKIKTDEQTYTVCKSFYTSYAAEELIIGVAYDVYFNSVGYIAWIEKPSGITDWIAAYCRKLYYDEESEDEEYIMKVYTQNGDLLDYRLRDKVKYCDENDDASNLKASIVFENIKSYKGLLRIKLYDGKIAQIEMPLPSREKAKTNDRLFKTASREGIFCNGVSFGGNIFWNSSSVIMSVPEDTDYTSGYSVLSVSATFRNSTTHKFEAYGTDPKSMVSKYFVTSKAAQKNFNENTPAMVVSDITQMCDDEDEACYVITGLETNAANLSTIKVKVSDDLINNVKSPFRDAYSETYTVQKGDVIRYTKDGYGYVDYIEIIYDANAEVDKGAENSIGRSGVKGWLCASDGYAPIAGAESKLPPIPYNVTHDGKLSYDLYAQNTGMRIMYGYVKSYKDGIITVTTQDLPNKGYDSSRDGNEKTATESYVLNQAQITYVNYNESVIPTRTAPENAIRDYDNYSKCSRAIILSNYGSVKGCIILNGEIDCK